MSADALLLTPGAGSGSDHPTLLAVEDAVAPLPTARIDFPYRLEGRPFPDRPPRLIGTIRDALDDLVRAHDVAPDAVVLGGRSMGGRMCSMAVAEGLPAAGLVLISYPLHPPKKPEKLRTEHLPDVDVPCLFISGTRDDFGTPDELERAHDLVAGPVTVVWVEGGRHELKKVDDQIVAAIVNWLTTL